MFTLQKLSFRLILLLPSLSSTINFVIMFMSQMLRRSMGCARFQWTTRWRNFSCSGRKAFGRSIMLTAQSWWYVSRFKICRNVTWVTSVLCFLVLGYLLEPMKTMKTSRFVCVKQETDRGICCKQLGSLTSDTERSTIQMLSSSQCTSRNSNMAHQLKI
jgi:hypothetical protein